MKTKVTFELYPPIKAMLDTAGYDVGKVINAIQSARNDVEGTEGDTKGTPMRLAKKGVQTVWKERTEVEFVGKTNSPMQFGSWHDSLEQHFNKHGAPSFPLTEAVLPAALYVWLCDKFKVAGKTEEKTETPAQPPAKDNGKRGMKPAGQPA